MWKQFVDKPFWMTLAGLAGMFWLSVWAYQSSFSMILLGMIGVAILILTLHRLDWALAVVFAELFANSHGHLVYAQIAGFTLSLRMVVFLAVMLGWAILFVQGKAKLRMRDSRWYGFFPLVVAVILGFLVGFSQNEVTRVFADGNAYFFLAYLLPILSVSWTPERRRLLLQVLCASAAWVVILSLGLLYFFTHYPEWMLEAVYGFIRDTRTAELTKMIGSLFRVFLQSQISVIFVLFLLWPFFIVRNMDRRDFLKLLMAFSAGASVIIIGLSRSFWVGILFGAFVCIVLSTRFLSSRISVFKRVVSVTFPSGIIGAFLLVLIVLFPLPYRVSSTGDLADLLSSRTTDVSDVAVSSRWKLLPAIWEEVIDSPLIGKGFGENVTFQTDDPRVRAFSPDGTWSTYALEWGWLELWLKMGFLGPISFFTLLKFFARGLWPIEGDAQAWLSVGLLSMIFALYATHVFSPYLNHPLGLGILLFCVPFLRLQRPLAETQTVLPRPALSSSAVQASTAPFTSE